MSETRQSLSRFAESHFIDQTYTSCDQHTEGLSVAYENVVMHPEVADENYRLRYSSLCFGELRLATSSTTSGMSFSASHNGSFHLGFVSRGGAQVHARQQNVVARPMQQASLVRGNDRFLVELTPASTAHVVEVSAKTLIKTAHEYMGRDVDTDSLTREVNLSRPAGAALARNVVSALIDLKTLRSASHNELAVASYSELLTGLVIASILPDYDAPSPNVGKEAIELARDYIVEHSNDALRISEVAAAAGMSVRLLQRNFRDRFGCSPLQYLVECRLENARIRLETAGPADTVTSIAWECGFIQLGLFAARYRGRFGELPSETLKRTQRK